MGVTAPAFRVHSNIKPEVVSLAFLSRIINLFRLVTVTVSVMLPLLATYFHFHTCLPNVNGAPTKQNQTNLEQYSL
jgi:hypothetical protein